MVLYSGRAYFTLVTITKAPVFRPNTNGRVLPTQTDTAILIITNPGYKSQARLPSFI